MIAAMDELSDPARPQPSSDERSIPTSREEKERLECAKLAAEIRKIEGETTAARSKDSLETERLHEQIRELKRPFWCQPAFYSAMVPIIPRGQRRDF
jgi:hypothetical protein